MFASAQTGTSGSGGAIYISYRANVTIINSGFDNNYAVRAPSSSPAALLRYTSPARSSLSANVLLTAPVGSQRLHTHILPWEVLRRKCECAKESALLLRLWDPNVGRRCICSGSLVPLRHCSRIDVSGFVFP